MTRKLTDAAETTATKPQLGDVIHVVDGAVTFAGDVHTRGAEIVLQQWHFDLATNRHGDCWLDDLSDAAQKVRWGRIRFGLGPWPVGEDGLPLPTWEYGSVEWEQARQRASAIAWAEADPTIRQGMLAEIDRRFGPMPTSWSHRSSGNALAVERQQRERAQRPLHENVSYNSDGSR